MVVTLAVLIPAAVALLLFGRGILAWWAQWMAARRISDHAISQAEQWLAWSAWFDPGDGMADLMQATCARHLGRADRWREAMQSAE
ncbi:MAG: hypothetical protein ABIK89_17360 [Planctomycetota bacterium]